MDRFTEQIFLEEINARCMACVAAVKEINTILRKEEICAVNLFRSLSELICQAAIISKLIWPPGTRDGGRAAKRGEALRSRLALHSDHPVKNKELRNHFEHYDERLDAWAESSRNHNIVKRLVGPRNAIGGDAISDGDIIEHFDPATNKFAFRGECFDIQELVSGVEDIHGRAKALLHSRLRV